MARNKETIWRCQNYGSCPNADESKPIPLEPEASFRCPECGGEEGVRIKAAAARLPKGPILLGVIGLLVLLLIAKLLQGPPPPPPLRKVIGITGREAEEDIRTAIDRQVLSRPDSSLYADAKGEPGEPMSGRKPKNFERFYVFAEKDEWLEVGESRNVPLGWMKAEDTVDWPHSIVVEYGSPENRFPVLFFRSEEDLDGLISDQESRPSRVMDHYREIEGATMSGDTLGTNYPVICMEPGQQVDDLYINPVLESKFVEVDGRQARILKVTAAGENRGATSFDNPAYMKLVRDNLKAKEQSDLEALEGVELELVFVVDTTGTMQPWVDNLLSAMRDLTARIGSNAKLADRVKLGFWGYRDSPGIPGIGYLTKNFTPSLLNAGEFTTLLADLKVNNKKTSDPYPEDVFSGVTDAIRKTDWKSENRFIMVIGDAPGHISVGAGGAVDIDAPQVRELATNAGVQIVSLAIKDSSNPQYIKYHDLLEKQFKALSINGNRKPAYLTVGSSEPQTFKDNMDKLVGELVDQSTLRKPEEHVEEDPAMDIAKGLLESAKVRLVSKSVDSEGISVVPRDITGWVLDRDLIRTDIESLVPKLLVTRTELNNLLVTSERLIEEAENAQITGGDFFDAVLKAVAGSASGNRSDTLKERMPEFIQGLPYKSDFMDKSKDWWANVSSAEKDRFIAEMKAKLSYYRMVNESPDLWRPLSRESDVNDQVAAIPLSQLL